MFNAGISFMKAVMCVILSINKFVWGQKWPCFGSVAEKKFNNVSKHTMLELCQKSILQAQHFITQINSILSITLSNEMNIHSKMQQNKSSYYIYIRIRTTKINKKLGIGSKCINRIYFISSIKTGEGKCFRHILIVTLLRTPPKNRTSCECNA